MLLNQLSRHKGLVGGFILLFVGLPMLLFIPGVNELPFLGGGGMGAETPVAMVGKTPVTAQEFVNRYAMVQDQRTQFGQPAGARDMVADGTVDLIMDALIREALVTEETKDQPIHPGQEYLEELLRKDPTFQNDKGEFDPGLYNQWVQQNMQGRANWDAMFAGIAEQVNRQKYMDLIGAAVRVPESEVRQQFYARNTTMKVKAAAVTPKVELTEEEIRAYYDANLAEFLTPEERVAEFISISLRAPVPPLAQELIDRARAGEDFAELARQNSMGIDADNGGEMDWIAESPELRDHEKPLFEMAVGEVRGPIESFIGLHIYKLEETRETDGVREVKARQIVLRAELPDAERAARTERAQALSTKARTENLNIAELAAAEGLDAQQTGRFSNRSSEIENIEEADMLAFRSNALQLTMGIVSPVIEGTHNLYVAGIVEIIAPVQRTFEDAREDARLSAVAQHKQTPEYRQKVVEYTLRIQQECTSLECMQTEFPELDVEIKETNSFGLNDMLFQQGLFMEGRRILERLVNKNPGEFGGPIFDMLQTPHFIEIVEKTVPEGETWEEQYATEKDAIREDVVRTRREQLQEDYMQQLRTQYIEAALVQQDDDMIYEILQIEPSAPAPAANTALPQEAPTESSATPAVEITPEAASEAPAAEEEAPATDPAPSN